MPGVLSTYRHIELRAYRISSASGLTGEPVRELFPGLRIFVERVRRGDRLIEADGDTVLQDGDVVSISGPRPALVERVEAVVPEVEDAALLDMRAEAVDLFVRSKEHSGKTVRQLADEPFARGVYLRSITRNLIEIPVLPETEILRGDVLHIGGSQRHVDAAVAALGHADRRAEETDLAFVGVGVALGGLVGALSYGWNGIPISLSTSGGALLAGLLLGYLRTVRPTFGYIPAPALWLMNTLGLNVFIAVVGINAGPGFVAGLQQVGRQSLPVGDRRHIAAADRRDPDRSLRLQVPPRDPLRRLRRRAHDHRRARHDPGSGEEQGAGARLWHAVRRRQHAAHDLRHGDRAADGARSLWWSRRRSCPRRPTWTPSRFATTRR